MRRLVRGGFPFLRCRRCHATLPKPATRRFSSTTSVHPSPEFLAAFERTAGPLPPHILSPSPLSSSRPLPPVHTRSVTRLPTGVTRVLLDIGVHDTPPPPSPSLAFSEAEREAAWKAQRQQRSSSSPSSLTPRPSPHPFSSPPSHPSTVDWVPCVLLVPPRPISSSPSAAPPLFPALLCLHQTTVPPSLGKEEPTTPGPLSYAYDLTALGYVTLSPDYPLFGSYHPSLSSLYAQYRSVTAKAVSNVLSCVDFLAHYPLVDPTRLGAIGHSLGASTALFAGLYDPRLRFLVSSCGFTSHRRYAASSRWQAAGAPPTARELSDGSAYTGDMRGWARRDKYMPLIAEEPIGKQVAGHAVGLGAADRGAVQGRAEAVCECT